MYLRCAAGAVEWMYPTGALIVNLRPNTFSPARHLTVCIRPFTDSSGANIYLEKTGELRLLVPDGDGRPGRVQCFGLEQGGLFVEATPQQDIGRRTTGFQYELIRRPRASDLHELSGECPAWGGGGGPRHHGAGDLAGVSDFFLPPRLLSLGENPSVSVLRT